MTYSVNNRLVLEAYKPEGLKADERHGFAMVGQKNSVKGMTLLMDAKLNDGSWVYKGSKIYIREEYLYTHQWAKQLLKSDELGDKPCVITDLSNVEFIVPVDMGTIMCNAKEEG